MPPRMGEDVKVKQTPTVPPSPMRLPCIKQRAPSGDFAEGSFRSKRKIKAPLCNQSRQTKQPRTQAAGT